MTQYNYGVDVIEFFQHNDNELQEVIKKAEDNYYGSVKSPLEINRLAASLHFHRSPLAVALPELIQLVQDGYTIRNDRFIGMQGALLDVTLSIPQAQIDKDLIAVHANAAAAYEADRYNRNKIETEYQIGVTLARNARDAEKAAQAKADAAAAKARLAAINDLREAYAA